MDRLLLFHSALSRWDCFHWQFFVVIWNLFVDFGQVYVLFLHILALHQGVKNSVTWCDVVQVRLDASDPILCLVFLFVKYQIHSKIPKQLSDLERFGQLSTQTLDLMVFQRFLRKTWSYGLKWSRGKFLVCAYNLKTVIRVNDERNAWICQILSWARRMSLYDTSLLYEPAHKLFICTIQQGCCYH